MEKDSNRNALAEMPFSRAVKAGKRIYYIDVKETRGGEYYLTLTESKKVVEGDEENPRVSFEKHKLFLYPEDFHKVLDTLQEAIAYVEEHQGEVQPRRENMDTGIQIDMEF